MALSLSAPLLSDCCVLRGVLHLLPTPSVQHEVADRSDGPPMHGCIHLHRMAVLDHVLSVASLQINHSERNKCFTIVFLKKMEKNLTNKKYTRTRDKSYTPGLVPRTNQILWEQNTFVTLATTSVSLYSSLSSSNLC